MYRLHLALLVCWACSPWAGCVPATTPADQDDADQLVRAEPRLAVEDGQDLDSIRLPPAYESSALHSMRVGWGRVAVLALGDAPTALWVHADGEWERTPAPRAFALLEQGLVTAEESGLPEGSHPSGIQVDYGHTVAWSSWAGRSLLRVDGSEAVLDGWVLNATPCPDEGAVAVLKSGATRRLVQVAGGQSRPLLAWDEGDARRPSDGFNPGCGPTHAAILRGAGFGPDGPQTRFVAVRLDDGDVWTGQRADPQLAHSMASPWDAARGCFWTLASYADRPDAVCCHTPHGDTAPSCEPVGVDPSALARDETGRIWVGLGRGRDFRVRRLPIAVPGRQAL